MTTKSEKRNLRRKKKRSQGYVHVLNIPSILENLFNYAVILNDHLFLVCRDWYHMYHKKYVNEWEKIDIQLKRSQIYQPLTTSIKEFTKVAFEFFCVELGIHVCLYLNDSVYHLTLRTISDTERVISFPSAPSSLCDRQEKQLICFECEYQVIPSCFTKQKQPGYDFHFEDCVNQETIKIFFYNFETKPFIEFRNYPDFKFDQFSKFFVNRFCGINFHPMISQCDFSKANRDLIDFSNLDNICLQNYRSSKYSLIMTQNETVKISAPSPKWLKDFQDNIPDSLLVSQKHIIIQMKDKRMIRHRVISNKFTSFVKVGFDICVLSAKQTNSVFIYNLTPNSPTLIVHLTFEKKFFKNDIMIIDPDRILLIFEQSLLIINCRTQKTYEINTLENENSFFHIEENRHSLLILNEMNQLNEIMLHEYK